MSNILLISATKLEHHDTNINNVPIHIIGIGKVKAALNTYKLIQKYKPDHVINFGSCGNLGNSKVGQVLNIGEVHDDFFGCVVPHHEIIYLSESNTNQYKLFTTDTFYEHNKEYHEYYNRKIKECDVIDMEGYSIAKVCHEANISVSIYKWISDSGDSTDWKANAAIGYNNFKKLFIKQYSQKS